MQADSETDKKRRRRESSQQSPESHQIKKKHRPRNSNSCDRYSNSESDSDKSED